MFLYLFEILNVLYNPNSELTPSTIAADILSGISFKTTPAEFDKMRTKYPASGYELTWYAINGQSALYIAASVGNVPLIEHIVKIGGQSLLFLHTYSHTYSTDYPRPTPLVAFSEYCFPNRVFCNKKVVTIRITCKFV